jgi:hypothetical protein
MMWVGGVYTPPATTGVILPQEYMVMRNISAKGERGSIDLTKNVMKMKVIKSEGELFSISMTMGGYSLDRP